MRRLALTALLGLSTAGATAYQDLITAIGEAQREVLVYAPSLYDLKLGNTLRRASRDPIRKVQVRVLSVPYYNYQPDSIMLSLAMAGVRVHEAQVPSKAGFVIVDGRGWKSATLGRMPEVPLTAMTGAEVTASINWFRATATRSRLITPLDAFERLEKIVP
ncbi:hypothetical protein [Deinococcus enclensis]|uniref:Uncharacterized protein n=1 Tax=Deinococcus enclensis TaxID=1049582 RepID=A0ABT9MHQ7_9DEIO|nr:hypothetical protein [Deinococcus enclensis]MDP9766120.1 hypothetical protein [Deinococcus enclensis]